MARFFFFFFFFSFLPLNGFRMITRVNFKILISNLVCGFYMNKWRSSSNLGEIVEFLLAFLWLLKIGGFRMITWAYFEILTWNLQHVFFVAKHRSSSNLAVIAQWLLTFLLVLIWRTCHFLPNKQLSPTRASWQKATV